jgi:Holliday junction resolvasome RuvABC endonuclease subunit
MNKICSIDASTNSMAFAIFHDDELIKYGKIKFSGDNAFEKVGDAARKTQAIFDIFDVDYIVIEQVVFLNSPKTLLDLTLVQGSIVGAAISSGIKKAVSVPPITWQNYLGNKALTKEEKFKLMSESPGKSKSWYKNNERSVRKNRTIKLIEINYDKIVTDNDVSDAIGIGHYAVNNIDKLKGLTD